MIAKVREQAGLTTQEIAEIVGVGQRQVQNWAAGQGTPANSQRLRQLLDLQYVLDLVAEVYDDEGGVMWLHARNRQLEGRRPLDLITDGETDRVIDLLDRLADGNF
ncbi:antitoxin Xre/MbcA/ParS toxin-binding domain-containing protein [Nocardioides hankookensis]